MKLDLDLIRDILVRMQEVPANRAVGRLELHGYEEDIVFEHLELLDQRGLIHADFRYAGSGERRISSAHVKNLTYEGHQFLANAQNNEIWNRAKSIVKDKGGSVSFEIFKSLLTQIAMNLLGVKS